VSDDDRYTVWDALGERVLEHAFIQKFIKPSAQRGWPIEALCHSLPDPLSGSPHMGRASKQPHGQPVLHGAGPSR
jgi:hypothetical protein